MNWNHLRATLWLRWRILANRVKRTGKVGNTLFGVLIGLGLCASVGFFFLALGLGIALLPKAEPMPLMLTWLALALGFAFSWMVGLMTDLQRSDAMSFKNLLHLPVSLSWIFLYNYLSSFVSISVAIFLPAMLGLWLAMVITGGPAMLLTLPLVLGFFGMITALTYQLRGWLGRLMENKRRGRNVIAIITLAFVVLLQLPNLINLSAHSANREERQRARAEERELRRAADVEGPGQAEARAKLALLSEEDAQEEIALDRQISLAAEVIPLGWLSYGMRATYEGRWLPGGLCALGLLTICAASLRRSYRTTLASVVGAGGGEARAAPAARATGATSTAVVHGGSAPSIARQTLLVQRTLPFVDERGASIAFAGLRSLLRAPEAKMVLLSPVIVLALFGVMLAKSSNRGQIAAFAPMLSLGATALGLLSMMQLIQNQFGLDRGGFRAFVLSPAPRREILRGKNLAIAPLGLGVGLIALIGLQCLVPVDVAHFLGGLLQLLSAYLLLCMLGNLTSILGPVRLKENGLKAANAKWNTILWQLLSVVLVPVALSPLMLPASLDFLLSTLGLPPVTLLYPALHALALIGICVLYRWAIQRQGELLQAREQHILDVLTRD